MDTLPTELGTDALSKFVLTLQQELTQAHDEARSAVRKLSRRCDELEVRPRHGIDIAHLREELSAVRPEAFAFLRDALRGTWVETLLSAITQHGRQNVVLVGPAAVGKSLVCGAIAAATSQVEVFDEDAPAMPPLNTSRCRITMARRAHTIFPDEVIKAERLPQMDHLSFRNAFRAYWLSLLP